MIREVDKALDYLRGGELERTESLVVLGSPSDSSGLIMSRVCLDLAPTYAMWEPLLIIDHAAAFQNWSY